MNEDQANWIKRIIAMGEHALNTATETTYEQFVDALQREIDTCPEP